MPGSSIQHGQSAALRIPLRTAANTRRRRPIPLTVAIAAIGVAIGLLLATAVVRILNGAPIDAGLPVPNTLSQLDAQSPGPLSINLVTCRTSTDTSRAMSGEPEQIDAVWVDPALLDVKAAGHVIPGLLTVPAGWCPGNPTVVVVAEQPGAEPWRDRLVAQLLANGAVVLELDVHTPRGVSADSAAAPPAPLPLELLPDIFGALRLLRRRGLDSGSTIVLGLDDGGSAALLAADEASAVRYLGAEGPRFVAHARLGSNCVWALAAGEEFPMGQKDAALQSAASTRCDEHWQATRR